MSIGAQAMSDANSNAAVTYGNYLKVDELLSLQQPRSTGPEHDEMLFIVIHQVYELWFKELLKEHSKADPTSAPSPPNTRVPPATALAFSPVESGTSPTDSENPTTRDPNTAPTTPPMTSPGSHALPRRTSTLDTSELGCSRYLSSPARQDGAG